MSPAMKIFFQVALQAISTLLFNPGLSGGTINGKEGSRLLDILHALTEHGSEAELEVFSRLIKDAADKNRTLVLKDFIELEGLILARHSEDHPPKSEDTGEGTDPDPIKTEPPAILKEQAPIKEPEKKSKKKATEVKEETQE